jgi:hypothetical protein
MSRRAIIFLMLAVPACGLHPSATAPAITPDGSPAAEPDAPAEKPATRSAILLDDFEGGGEIPVMWLLNRSPGATLTITPPVPPRATSRQAMHVSPAPTAMDADVFTHHHFDWTRMFAGMRFWVRADDPAGAELALAVTSTISETHVEALAAGSPWLMARLHAGPDWAQVTVRFDTLVPEGPGTPQATFGGLAGISALHFLAPSDGGSGVWLDDIELLCAGTGCAAAP